MSVNFPNKSGAIQNKIRVITKRINNVSKKLDPKTNVSQLKSKLNKYKSPKYNLDIKSSYEKDKFEPVAEYIKSSYSGATQVANDIAGTENTLECEVAMRKIQDKLDEMTKMFESLAGKLDNLLDPIQEPLSTIESMLSLIEDISQLHIDNVEQLPDIVEQIIKLLVWIVGTVLKPFIYTVDTMYKGYRELKVTAGVELSRLDSILNVQCIVNCKYKLRQRKCPVLKKLDLTSCPLLEVNLKIKDLVDNIESLIDGVTSPIDNALDSVDRIVNMFPVNKVINRRYPKVNISIVKNALKKISSESYMNQDGVTTQPDISSEIKTPEVSIT